MKQQLTYTGKLFRRIAIACGAWTGNPHKVWESHLRIKYFNDYYDLHDYLHVRGKDGKWTCIKFPVDDRGYEFWKAMKWLRENGYITVRKAKNACRNTYGYVRFTVMDNEIRLTEKGMAAAPAYMKIKED